MAMVPQTQTLHFILLPHLSHGHLIPMTDIAKLLAQHGVTVTMITTPLNAAVSKPIVDRAIESGLLIQLLQVQFPCTDVGLPEGCESMDALPSKDMFRNLLIGISKLQQPVEQILAELNPRPSCIIADKNFAWAERTALKFQIPRIEITKAQLPNAVNIFPSNTTDIRNEIREAEQTAFGVIVNSFEELEPAYIREFRKERGEKVWCIGPVSLTNQDNLDKVARGNKASIDETQCLKWLDSWKPSSVVYVCLGSLGRLSSAQLIELGLGLEASNQPFIWTIRGGDKLEELEKWILEEKFEDRIRGRGLLIRGWAPQLLILSHPAIGGFLTHCGWNSTLEGICAGLPMITWPLFAEQFYNEKLIVQVLKIGVSLGAEFAVPWAEEEKFGVALKREEFKRAINQLVEEGEAAQERRKRARELGEMAKTAIEGSSYLNMKLLIQDVMQQVVGKLI
nr:udp-glycosyltransferase 73c5 [Quercus suber]